MASVTLFVSACGGGVGADGGDGGDGGYGNEPQPNSPPLLQIGMQRQYSGTATRTVVYANPTGTQHNNTLAYTFSKTVKVLLAPNDAPAPFDVRSEITYNVTQDPGVGTVPVSNTTDSYQNLLASGNQQATSTLAQSSTMIEKDETSNALGDGPYTITSSTNTSYPIPVNGQWYPLQAGAGAQVPIASIANTSYNDVNPSGLPPSNGANVAYNQTVTKNSDGSYTAQTNRANGVVITTTVNGDGSASISNNGGTSSSILSIGVPVQTNGSYQIPVILNTTSPTPSSKSYMAMDWYPGNGLPNSPLANETQTVIGPVIALPSACSAAMILPNMFEIDTTSYTLGTAGSYTTSQTQSFNSNGVSACSINQQTSYAYNIYTGALMSTTMTQTTTWLTGLSPSM